MDSQAEESKIQDISDNCPQWADELIRRIYLLEIESGTIKNPTSDQWSTATQDELLKLADRLENSAGEDLEEQVEALFHRVARGLAEADYSPEETAAMINRRIPTGCKLQYCSASEVLAVLV